jgi:hypothetical protein
VPPDPPANESPRELSPFSLPSDTDLRFVLLILLMLAASSFMYMWIYNGTSAARADQHAVIKECIPILR